MRIHIQSIPFEEHRYPTCGDYWDKDGVTEIRVSQMDPDYEFLVAMHELIEYYLVKKRGIAIETIDDFDRSFEIIRKLHPETIGDQEPGDMISAPYFNEHRFATKIEKLIAEELGVDWNKYEESIPK